MTAAALTPPRLVRNSLLDENQPPNSPPNTMHHQPRSSILFQWMETCAAGLFSTCEGNAQSPWSAGVRNETLHALDYSQLHDHFLEHLLQEAAKPNNNNNQKQTQHKVDLFTSGGLPEDSDSSVLSANKKRRLARLTKKTHKLDDSKQPAIPPGQPYDPSAPLPLQPEDFLHEHVRMQKDKGRGEEPGSVICAKGQDECLHKLRVKMQLLCNTAIQEKGASMKRRPARESVHLDNFCETRSVLEVRLGFLSMMYGILLRWDTNITGKITLVVLRKMCHESFYPTIAKTAVTLNTSTSETSTDEDESDEVPHVLKGQSLPQLVEGRAVVDWPDGTEVSILDPPYLIPRPEKFRPSVLTVSTLHARGLDRKASWMAQFILGLDVVSLNLVFDESKDSFVPKTAWQGITYEIESPDASLDVKLFQLQNRPRRRKCVGDIQVPLSNLPVQKDPPTHLSFPCKDGTLALDLFLESDYMKWAESEMEARRKAASFFWPRSSSRQQAASPPAMIIVDTDDDDDDDDDDSWGWILCYMC